MIEITYANLAGVVALSILAGFIVAVVVRHYL